MDGYEASKSHLLHPESTELTDSPMLHRIWHCIELYEFDFAD